MESAPEQPAPRMKVLVAEDNPVFQSMLRALLTRWGYDVVAARDGREAWRILESAATPRLAILDWMMPGMDGVELCRRVRAASISRPPGCCSRSRPRRKLRRAHPGG